MTKGGKQEVAAVGHNSYAGTRFNAVKHAVLSRYTVLPWEDETEYGDLLEALVGEHTPEGPTETHLVEELAGIFWRKRRLRLAEASAMREGLHRATRSYSDTGEAALVCVSGGTGDVGEALRATPEQTEQEDAKITRGLRIRRRSAVQPSQMRNSPCSSLLPMNRFSTIATISSRLKK